ncbi:hypothetical protein DENSPDRAFT_842340 [Dentipellis sp. KUC8613]|nr:hypothetical protein DENSPDRAFT_842340 [Dentipellis sp. KUC8613]
MRETLVRSKALPLSMKLFVQDEEEASISSKHMSRTIHLWLRIEDILVFDTEDNLLLQPAPMLETCTLDLISDDDADIPVHLFADYAPRLRALTLRVCAMRWTCPVFTGLVELSVSFPGEEESDNPFEERQDEPYCTEFFRALSQMSKLETLTLVNCLTKSREAFTAATRPARVSDIANLGSLKMLNVTGTPLGAASLVSRIRVPSTCKVAVTFKLDFIEIRNDADAVLFLLPRLVGFLGQPVRRIAICGFKRGDDYDFSLWTRTHPWPDNLLFPSESTRSQYVEGPSSKPNIRIIALVPRSDISPPLASNLSAMANAVRKVCFAEVPFRGIQVVDIADRVLTWKWKKWGLLCRHMAHVKHVRVGHRHRMGILDWLTRDLDNPVAPHLETLTVTNESSDEDIDKERTFLRAFIDSFPGLERSAPLLKRLYLQGYQPGFAQEVGSMIDQLGAAQIVEITVGGSP